MALRKRRKTSLTPALPPHPKTAATSTPARQDSKTRPRRHRSPRRHRRPRRHLSAAVHAGTVVHAGTAVHAGTVPVHAGTVVHAGTAVHAGTPSTPARSPTPAPSSRLGTGLHDDSASDRRTHRTSPLTRRSGLPRGYELSDQPIGIADHLAGGLLLIAGRQFEPVAVDLPSQRRLKGQVRNLQQ
jgi:hypothetical protein